MKGKPKKKLTRVQAIKQANLAADKESLRVHKYARMLSKSPEFIALFERFKRDTQKCSPPRFGIVWYRNDGWTKLRPCLA